MMAGRTSEQKCFRWAEKSAAQGERDGFLHLGYCYRYGIGCEKDLERAKENSLVAAELGDLKAMVCLATFFGKDDPQRFFLVGKCCCKWKL
jgi:TPR repeat protein